MRKLATLLLLLLAVPALAQTYPAKPVRIIVHFAPAGGTPEQFAAQIKKEIEVWRKVATAAGVKAE